MCGIVGYLGKNAAPRIYAALKKLEYRGYDSAGIALLSDGKFTVRKKVGPVAGLKIADLAGNCGVGHTRWATHGAPTEQNAHPHVYGRFAVVHNGIIENYRTLKEECLARGEVFSSETDSEVIAHMLEHSYRGDLLEAVRAVTARLVGSYALAILCSDCPETVALAREKSPLIVGRGHVGLWCASDVPALAEKGMQLYPLGDGEFAVLHGDEAAFYDRDGAPLEKKPTLCDAARDTPEKGGFLHFMRKEIAEIPSVLRRRPHALTACGGFYEALCAAEHIGITACGTAYHAGLAAKYAFERLARMPCEVSFAGEYRYYEPIVPEKTLMLAVSQSGETADTIAAARLAKERGAVVAAVVNEEKSTLAALADFVVPVGAGREIAVAATKSYAAQVLTLDSMAASLAERRGLRGYGDLLKELPDLAEETLSVGEGVRAWVAHFLSARSVYFIGRGVDYAAALEGSLKLKEISYLPSEGYPASELKHGTLALIEAHTPVVAVLTSEALAEKTMNAVHEVTARGASVFLVTTVRACAETPGLAGAVLLPQCGDVFSPAISVIPLQLLAYYVSLARGNDPDRPRNLAKSVTVE